MASNNVAAPALTYTTVPTAGLDQAVPGGLGNVLTSEVLNQTVMFHFLGWDVTFGGVVTLTLGLVAVTVLLLNGYKLCKAMCQGIKLIRKAKNSNYSED